MEIASEGVWCGVLHTCDMFPTPGPLTRPARPQTPFIPHDENIYISSLSTFQADARALLTAGARLGIDPEHLRLLTGGLHPLNDLCHGWSASRWLSAVIEFLLSYSRS